MEQEARTARRAQKRKAQEALLKVPGVKKKVRIDTAPTEQVSQSHVSRPRKKSERVSWLPAEEDGPTRTSTRTLTVQNKESVYARMQENEKRRKRQMEIMEASAKRKEATKRPVMTQADRLAEAAKTERKNAKSLTRYEESEKQRAAEQKAKLEALQSRNITGPMIRWWSGKAEWVDGVLRNVGRKAKVELAEDDNSNQEGKPTDGAGEDTITVTGETEIGVVPPTASEREKAQIVPKSPPRSSMILQAAAPAQSDHGPTRAFLDGIHYYASLPPRPSASAAAPPQPTLTEDSEQKPASSPANHAGTQVSTASAAEPTSRQKFVYYQPLQEQQQQQQQRQQQQQQQYPTARPAPPPPPLIFRPPLIEHSTRNLLILANFDTEGIKEKDKSSHILNIATKPPPRPSRPTTCALTGLPARYIDPATGLSYSGAYAYKGIQRLLGGTCQWSNLLGAWVGPSCSEKAGRPAMGVPECFHARRAAAKLEGPAAAASIDVAAKP